jgi:hypothetical protein
MTSLERARHHAAAQRSGRVEPTDEDHSMSRLFVVAVALVCAACPASTADVAMSEQIIQLGDGLNDLRQQNAEIQAQVDSLRVVVAKQDTVIRQLANLAGVPLAR